MAERAGFEPAVPFTRHTRFPGEPIKPLWHLSIKVMLHLTSVWSILVAERAGFEPAIRLPRILVFETSALSRSATSPSNKETSNKVFKEKIIALGPNAGSLNILSFHQ